MIHQNKITAALLLSSCLWLTACTSNTEVSSNGVPASGNNPKAAGFNTQLGLGYLAKGNMQRAKTKLLLAQSQDPKSSTVLGSLGFFYEKTQDTKQADFYYRKAIEVSDLKGPAYNNYGAFLCRQGDFKLADQYFQQATQDEQYVDSAEAFENAGLCALQNGRLNPAKDYFNTALARDPQRHTSVLELGEIAYRQHNIKLASEYLSQYEKIATLDSGAAWLGYRVAKKMGRAGETQRYARLLSDQFRQSSEYKLYQNAG